MTDDSTPTVPSQPQTLSWKLVLKFLAVVGPHLWFLYAFVGKLFPNSFLGQWYTVIIDVALGMGIALAVTGLLHKFGLAWWLRPGWRGQVFNVCAVGGWLLLPSAFMWAHVYFGTPLRYPSDCGDWLPLVPENCEGRDFSMMQGRHSYQRVRGQARGAICERLRETDVTDGPTYAETGDDSQPDCDLELLEGWRMRACGQYGLPSDWSCYICERVGAGHSPYSLLQAYDRGCRKGVGYDTVGVPLQDVPTKLDTFSSAASLWR